MDVVIVPRDWGGLRILEWRVGNWGFDFLVDCLVLSLESLWDLRDSRLRGWDQWRLSHMRLHSLLSLRVVLSNLKWVLTIVGLLLLLLLLLNQISRGGNTVELRIHDLPQVRHLGREHVDLLSHSC